MYPHWSHVETSSYLPPSSLPSPVKKGRGGGTPTTPRLCRVRDMRRRRRVVGRQVPKSIETWNQRLKKGKGETRKLREVNLTDSPQDNGQSWDCYCVYIILVPPVGVYLCRRMTGGFLERLVEVLIAGVFRWLPLIPVSVSGLVSVSQTQITCRYGRKGTE